MARVGLLSLWSLIHRLIKIMSDAHQADAMLVQRIREGDTDAWGELIGRYEGRLLAFAEKRKPVYSGK